MTYHIESDFNTQILDLVFLKQKKHHYVQSSKIQLSRSHISM